MCAGDEDGRTTIAEVASIMAVAIFVGYPRIGQKLELKRVEIVLVRKVGRNGTQSSGAALAKGLVAREAAGGNYLSTAQPLFAL
jgi:hypothetical protein